MISMIFRALYYVFIVLPWRLLQYLAWKMKLGWKLTELKPDGMHCYRETWMKKKSKQIKIVTKGNVD